MGSIDGKYTRDIVCDNWNGNVCLILNYMYLKLKSANFFFELSVDVPNDVPQVGLSYC